MPAPALTFRTARPRDAFERRPLRDCEADGSDLEMIERLSAQVTSLELQNSKLRLELSESAEMIRFARFARGYRTTFGGVFHAPYAEALDSLMELATTDDPDDAETLQDTIVAAVSTIVTEKQKDAA